jgi:DDE family transposase
VNKFTHLSEFLGYLLDNGRAIEKAAVITAGILKARSCRLSEIAREMPGSERGNYKCIQRFVAGESLKPRLLRLYQDESAFMIGDPTEMPRPGAKKTGYVGKLSDGQTSGYWLLVLATPYQGRAIPCHFVSYSSAIIDAEITSRNRYHFQAFAEVKELLGDKPLVLDREFSYLELLQVLIVEEVNFVIRLKVGAHFFDAEGQPVALTVKKGETRILNKVFYMGKVFVNLIGRWKEGFNEPIWITPALAPGASVTNLPAEQGLDFYLQRMKIEQTFRDLKSLLGMDKLMCQKRPWMEQMVSLVLIAYAIGLILGETLRSSVFPETNPKRKLFSGLFVLLKLKLALPYPEFRKISSLAQLTFHSIVLPVRTFV